MLIFIAKSRSGWGVMVGADMVRNCGVLEEARSFASELCDEALARGEEAEVADLSDCDTPPLI
jgi:hypothetical protein